VLGLLALALVGSYLSEGTQKGTTTQTSENASKTPAAVAAPSPPLPEQQQKFLSINDDFAAKYRSAANEMAQGALRVQRASAICSLFQSPTVKDWVGTVQTLSSNNEGKGVLNVSMNKIANAKTWNNALSDIGSETLIQPGTPLHDAALQLARNDTIIFSGTFLKDDKDCFKESSLTQRGSMTDPDWIFRFSAVTPAK
jgi:hypothetical protein